MVGTSQMAATAVVLIALAISWTPRGIVMAAAVEQRLEERMEIMEEKTEDRLARLEVRIAQLLTSLRVDELIPKVDAVLRKFEENCPTTCDTLSSVLRAVEAASTTSNRVEMGLAKLEEKSGKTEKKLDDIENGVEKGLGGLEESMARMEERLARIEERSGKTEKKLDGIEIGVEKGLGRLEESLARMEERLMRMEERSGKTEEKMERIEEKTEEKLVRMEEKIVEGLAKQEERMTQLVTSLKVELESRSPSTFGSPPSALLPAEAASTSPGTATTPIPPMASEMEKPLSRKDALLRTLEEGPSTTSDPQPSALRAVAAASTTSSTTLTSSPPITPEDRKTLGEALFEASKEGRARDVEKLLQDGADVHYRRKDWHNGTPLLVASAQGHVDVIALLIGAGADMNAGDSTDWTPLHWAAFREEDAPVKNLIDAGADVNSQNYWGETPLHHVAEHGYVAVAQALIAAGAEVNKQDNHGQTPLHEAVFNGRKEMVKALIAAGARKDVRDRNGKTPYEVADPSVRDLLQP